MNTIMTRVTCLMAVLFGLVWTTSAVASTSRYLSFEGCVDFVSNTVPLSVGDCYEGRLAYTQQNGTTDISVTEFWFEIGGQRVDIDDVENIIYEYNGTYGGDQARLQVLIGGTTPFGTYELTEIHLRFELLDDSSRYLALGFGGDANNAVVGPITGGTIMYYPESAPLEEWNTGLNDAWYEPATSGQGFFVTVFPVIEKVSIAWFTYDTELPSEGATSNLGDSGHRWITALGEIVGNASVMDVTLTKGGLFDTAIEVQPVENSDGGTFILTFDTCNSGTVEYELSVKDSSEMLTGIVPITRIAGDNVALCEALMAD